MFKEEREELKFDWSMIGNIGEGRPNVGATMDVSVYRLMQFSLRDVLIKMYDTEIADKIFYEAGMHAHLDASHSDILDAIREKGAMSDEQQEKLVAALEEFTKNFQADSATAAPSASEGEGEKSESEQNEAPRAQAAAG